MILLLKTFGCTRPISQKSLCMTGLKNVISWNIWKLAFYLEDDFACRYTEPY